jgi:glycosyltransferase 2 family protein
LFEVRCETASGSWSKFGWFYMKKLIITLLKVCISFGLIGYLIWDATQSSGKANVFHILRDQPKNWWMLAGACALCLTAVLMTFVRWWYLVRALDIPCRFADAIRISFWGYLFNLAPLGIVGGDLLKSVMLAHQHRQYRAKAVASVLFDRIVGLYLLFVVGSAAILLTDFWRIQISEIHLICNATFLITIAGTVGISLTYVPGVIDGPFSRALGRLPRVGRLITSLIDAVGLYRYKPMPLVITSLMSICVHCLYSVGIYLIASGLFVGVPSLGSHFVYWPLSAATAVLPLPLGPFEFVLDFLYSKVPQAGVTIPDGQGLVVALCFRLITVIIASMGIYYYLGNRREAAEAIHESEQESLEDFAE